jgi:hypothetical protein
LSREQAKGIIMAKTNAETKIANAGGTAVETGKTAARAAAGKYSAPRLSRLALKALVDMVTSEELKPSDRLSAIKTILDYAGKQAPPEDTDAELHVVFDGLEEGFAD